MMSKLFIALENEEVLLMDQQQEIVNDIEIQKLENESNEYIVEVQQMDDVVSTAIESMSQLVNIEKILQTSVDRDKGLPEDAAEIAKTAIETICIRLGYTPAKNIIPSLESFGEVSRIDATKYALESIKETVTKIWDAIKTFFINIWNKLKDFWKFITDINIRLKKKVETTQQRVYNLIRTNAVVKDNSSIDITKYCIAFNSKNANNIMNDLAQTFTAHIYITRIQSQINARLNRFVDLVEKHADINEINEYGTETSHIYFKGIDKKLIFGKMFNLKEGIDLRFNGIKSNKIKPENTESKVLDIGDLSKIVKASKALLNDNIDTIEQYNKLKKVVYKTIKAVNKISDEIRTSNKVDNNYYDTTDNFLKSANLRIIASNLRHQTNDAYWFNTLVPKINAQAISLGCDLVNLNIKQYISTSAVSKSTDLVVV